MPIDLLLLVATVSLCAFNACARVIDVPFRRANAQLDPGTMQTHLTNGAPILGNYTTSSRSMSKWMAMFPDSTPLATMNIPGTHDSCTWSFQGLAAPFVRTQDVSIFEQLDAGVRFFDIRFGRTTPNDTRLSLFHGDALLSETVQVEDLLWGFYKFLEDHPSEALLLSMKVDHGDTDVELQKTMNGYFTSEPTNAFWVQDTSLGTLGDARGRIVPVRRFGYSSDSGLQPVGIDVSQGWADNQANITIQYSDSQTLSIEDLYMIDQPLAADVITTKFNALTAHLRDAMARTGLTFFSFASGTGAGASLATVTPQVMARGDGNLTGVNARLLPFLQQLPSDTRRTGVTLLDFFESPAGLVVATIGAQNVTDDGSTPVPSSSAISPSSSPTQSGAARAVSFAAPGRDSPRALLSALLLAYIVRLFI